MNRWIILYDDGKTPMIHHGIVEATTMPEALGVSGVDPAKVWACALARHAGTAAASLLRASLNQASAAFRPNWKMTCPSCELRRKARKKVLRGMK